MAGAFFKQTYFIPKPTLTEENLPDQSGKVHIVTGGYAGIGLELTKILYQKNATIYAAGRSGGKAKKAIEAMKIEFANSTGKIEFLQLDLDDLSTIKRSAEEFLSKESRLDVLVNNAGVMVPPAGSKTKQGYDLQMGVNCIGPFLFTQFLLPILQKTAATAPAGSVRITWASSLAADLSAPKGGVEIDKDGAPKVQKNPELNYGQSKSGNVMFAVEAARRYGKDGIISTAWNPGHLKSELSRTAGLIQSIFIKLLANPPKLGGYTELYAGWSPDITLDNNGAYVIPWGRIGEYNSALAKVIKPEAKGGEGRAERLWDWCERETKKYT
ncbi:NAD(P)-binding protein [Cenococcum geophilum 1.58]|uniref:NAD(P)-binding protein n=1 Tax=Cenococcum geophilum 1.58 TaxID=794803 RepID=UPI00358E63E5|nr:NAD(P)-binding protein [Cenococcum geophilum 1.58]